MACCIGKAHSIKSKHLGSVPEPASNSAGLIPLGPNFLVSKMSKASYDYHTLCKLHYSFIQYLGKTCNAFNGDIKCLQEPTKQMRWRNNINRGKGTWKIHMEEMFPKCSWSWEWGRGVQKRGPVRQGLVELEVVWETERTGWGAEDGENAKHREQTRQYTVSSLEFVKTWHRRRNDTWGMVEMSGLVGTQCLVRKVNRWWTRKRSWGHIA